ENFPCLHDRIPSLRAPVGILDEEVAIIEALLGHKFANKAVIEEEMTHPSSSDPTEGNKNKGAKGGAYTDLLDMWDHEILTGEQAVSGIERTSQYWNRLDIPKDCFANIVESAFGAVFIDSRFDLQATQRLFHKIVRSFFMKNFPTV
ncbi:hypothetical protein BGZ79_003115, partial [Entomortierella chlamydospora]